MAGKIKIYNPGGERLRLPDRCNSRASRGAAHHRLILEQITHVFAYKTHLPAFLYCLQPGWPPGGYGRGGWRGGPADPHLQGDDVLALQQRLLELGYTEVGTPDGDFGQKTDAAVRQFQQVNGLEVDGVVGPKSWERLFSSDAIGVK